MIEVHEPGEVIYTRDAYQNIHRLMVDVHGRILPEAPRPLSVDQYINAHELLADDRSD